MHLPVGVTEIKIDICQSLKAKLKTNHSRGIITIIIYKFETKPIRTALYKRFQLIFHQCFHLPARATLGNLSISQLKSSDFGVAYISNHRHKIFHFQLFRTTIEILARSSKLWDSGVVAGGGGGGLSAPQ